VTFYRAQPSPSSILPVIWRRLRGGRVVVTGGVGQDGGAMTESGNRWVFGYGSLIWNPGFAFLRSEKALLRGAHRSLSIYSHRHRGTPEKPGLVFGLSRGGSCLGVAFEVAAAEWENVFAYLQEREQDRGVYREAWRNVVLASGATVEALAYLVNEKHPQFAGRLEVAQQVKLVSSGTGESGGNVEYVRNTAQHLLALGIHDKMLMEIVNALDGSGPLMVESA
jgi:cation transport protein ChaC